MYQRDTLKISEQMLLFCVCFLLFAAYLKIDFGGSDFASYFHAKGIKLITKLKSHVQHYSLEVAIVQKWHLKEIFHSLSV